MPSPQILTITGFNPNALPCETFPSDVAEMFIRGVRVDAAIKTLPETGELDLFTVTGKVMVMQLLGEVTTVIQTQACNYSLEFNPTIAGSNVVLCAVLNISAVAVGALFGITGTAATAMATGASLLAQVTPLILQPGAIVHKTSATNTGAVQWSCWYIPLTDDGLIVAA